MHESIDWPRRGRRASQPPRFFIIILVILAVIFFGRPDLSVLLRRPALVPVSLGYGPVFWKTLSLQWEIFGGFLLPPRFSCLYGSFLALKRAHLPDLPEAEPS